MLVTSPSEASNLFIFSFDGDCWCDAALLMIFTTSPCQILLAVVLSYYKMRCDFANVQPFVELAKASTRMDIVRNFVAPARCRLNWDATKV